jgi:hypothetical protein
MAILREYDPEFSSVLFAGVFFFAGLIVFQHSATSGSFIGTLVLGSASIAFFCLSYIYALRGVQEALLWFEPARTKASSPDGNWTTVQMEKYLVDYLRYLGMSEYDGITSPNETVYRMAQEDDDIDISELRGDEFDASELRGDDADISDLR